MIEWISFQLRKMFNYTPKGVLPEDPRPPAGSTLLDVNMAVPSYLLKPANLPWEDVPPDLWLLRLNGWVHYKPLDGDDVVWLYSNSKGENTEINMEGLRNRVAEYQTSRFYRG